MDVIGNFKEALQSRSAIRGFELFLWQRLSVCHWRADRMIAITITGASQ